MIPKNKNCVVLACNEGFLTPALFVCQQLLTANSRMFDVVISSGEDLTHSIPENIFFLQADMDSFTDQLPESPRLKNFAYWRIPAIERLSDFYERILYLDADVFIDDPSQIGEILDIPMGEHALAAVRDVHQLTRPDRLTREHRSLRLPSTPYFNSGVLLIQSSRWQSLKLYEKIIRLTKTHRDHLFCHDQSLLNLASEGQWLELAPVWNWQYSKKNNFLTEVISPKIIHFAGAVKLWHAPNGDTPQRYWQAYQAFLQAKGFDQPKHTYPALSKQMFKAWGLSLIKNIWYFGPYKRYLSRFETPFSVVAHSKRFEI